MMTTAVPAREGFARWRERIATTFGQLDVESVRGVEPQTPVGQLAERTLGRVAAFYVSGSPQIIRRTPRAISRAPADGLKVCIQQRGRTVVHQNERELVIRPGQLAVYDTGVPYDLDLAGTWSCAVMLIPRDALGLSHRSLRDAMSHTWQISAGPGVALTHLLTGCTGQEVDQSSPFADAALGEAGLNLMSSLLDAVEPASLERASSSDLTRRTYRYIHDHLDDIDLSLAGIAHELAISERTLHRLFRNEPQGVAELIRVLRLEAIRSDLADPRLRRRSVMAIATGWGFPDQSHFTRAFRQQFGVTPAAWRRSRVGEPVRPARRMTR